MTETGQVPSPEAGSDPGLDFTEGAWQALLHDKDLLKLPDLTVQTLRDFLTLADSSTLTPEQKNVILDEATFLIGNLYPHLPFKEQLYSSARPLELLQQANTFKVEREWHTNVIFSISSVLDAHTLYGLPNPYRDAVAFLPFELKVYWDKLQQAHFVVTGVMKSTAPLPELPDSFGPGAEVVEWNGVLADSFIPTSRGSIPSGNYYTRIRRGTMLSTLLPLRFCQPPAEERATLQYIPAGGGDPQEITLKWGVASGLGSKTGFPGTAFSVSPVTHCADAMRRAFVWRSPMMPAEPPSPADLSLLPDVFEFHYSGGAVQAGLLDPQRLRPGFGYIRIKKFSLGNTLGEALVEEFRRILETVMNPKAPVGLVIDIRGNPGGDIAVAEALLQMLAADPISPLNFHMANTAVVRDFLRGLKTPDFSKLLPANILKVITVAKDLKPWIDDVEHFDPSSSLSTGHPLTDPKDANAIGRIYHGKVALLVDALSYSASDIFAAGFQDHEIGPVIGSDATTGGGGANVWSHSDLANHLTAIPSLPDLKPLPNDSGLSLAIRRASRVKKHAGIAIEDFGVTADVFFAAASADELLNGSQSIVQFACDHLAHPKDPKLSIQSVSHQPQNSVIAIECSSLDFVQIYVDGFLCGMSDVTGESTLTLRVAIPPNTSPQAEVCVRGCYFYKDGGPDNFVFAAEATFVPA